jgi:preprotein translocase subunit SecG
VLHFVVRRDTDVDEQGKRVEAVKIGLQVLLVIGGMFLTLLILLHKGKGGGLSDMFGGGMSTSLGSSSVAERNLDRFTVAVAIVWFACIVGLGLIERFSA